MQDACPRHKLAAVTLVPTRSSDEQEVENEISPVSSCEKIPGGEKISAIHAMQRDEAKVFHLVSYFMSRGGRDSWALPNRSDLLELANGVQRAQGIHLAHP